MYPNSYSIGSKHAICTSRPDDAPYPHVERLCEDFGLQVSETPDAEGSAEGGRHIGSRAFGLVVRYVESTQYLTPIFSSMRQLEAFVADNMVDILHGYLCSEADPS